jgi:hypothetical protein
MMPFYIQIGIQTIIIGVAFYFLIEAIYKSATAKNWGARAYHFVVSLLFTAAIFVTGMFWWDTISTHNTFFSEPMPKLIPIQQKQ